MNRYTKKSFSQQANFSPSSEFPKNEFARDSRLIAERLLGPIMWTEADRGFCHCPGLHLHTTPSGPKDCAVALDQVPTIYCFHTSCAVEVAGANFQLRRQLGSLRAGVGQSIIPAVVQLERLMARQRAETQRARDRELFLKTKAGLPEIIRRFAWSEQAIRLESDFDFPQSSGETWRCFLRAMFPLDAVVWIGERFHSGDEKYRGNFRRVAEWLQGWGPPPGPLVSSSVFAEAVMSRANANVIARPFLVLDGDSVDAECAAKQKRDEQLTNADKARNFAASLAVINWLRREAGLTLHAVVDAGNKSPHAWFAFPNAGTLAELETIIVPLGFDPSTFRPSQPVRLPGVKRPQTDRMQRLLFLRSPLFSTFP